MSHDTEIESVMRGWRISVFGFLCGFEERQTAPLQGTVTVLITQYMLMIIPFVSQGVVWKFLLGRT